MIYRVLLLFVLLGSCSFNEQSKHKDLEKNKKTPNEKVSKNQILTNLFRTYINEKEKLFSSNITPIYSAYFFKQGDKSIVTLWAGTQFPDYIEDFNPNSKFNYYKCNKIENHKTVLIFNDKDFLESLENFQDICSDDIDKYNLINLSVIYDGSWYPESYVLFNVNNSYSFKKCNKKHINFLGQDYIKYEEQLK